MGLRWLIVLVYAAALLAALLRRPRQAARAAGAAGAEIEALYWVRSPRAPRLLVWVAGALLVSFLGKAGFALALLFALLTAPLAAAGSVRLLSTCRAGLVIDERVLPWEGFAGFTVAGGELRFLPRDAGGAVLTLAPRARQLRAAADAVGRHLAEVRPAAR